MNAALEAAKARGRSEGEARGEARGRSEGQAEAARRITRQLLELGQSDEVIFKATGALTSSSRHSAMAPLVCLEPVGLALMRDLGIWLEQLTHRS